MSPDIKELSPSELAVLESLHGSQGSVSQRELARRTGLSVGLVNAVIKRLVLTGYVKTSHLNKRQFEYLLTPEGFARTALRSYHYVVDTVRRFKSIQTKLRQILARLGNDGIGEFHIYGEGELADLAAMFCEEEGKVVSRGMPTRRWGRKSVILNASPEPLSADGWRVIDLSTELKLTGHPGVPDTPPSRV